MTDILDELQWRGLLAQHTDLEALREHLNSGPVTFYCGYDPTAPSLHHGHLVQLIVMRHGKVVDHGTREEVLNHPTSDYTKKLLESVPEMEGKRYV